MNIEILGAESIGARSLSCFITTRKRRILIDPGVALGMHRFRLPPHPVEVAAACDIRDRIVERWKDATDVVISHFHGDHSPMLRPDVYHLAAVTVLDLNRGATVWTKSRYSFAGLEKDRGPAFLRALGDRVRNAEATTAGEMTFSPPVPHGDPKDTRVTVLMTRIEDELVFVHASDIQLLNDEAVDQILLWKPDVVLAAGPPLYLALSRGQLERAERNTVRLLKEVETLILDHHLLRSEEGLRWSRRLSSEAKGSIVSAAEFAGATARLLEANRKRLFRDQPVPKGWHRDYAAGRATTDAYRE